MKRESENVDRTFENMLNLISKEREANQNNEIALFNLQMVLKSLESHLL